jgi:hypothetical protein
MKEKTLINNNNLNPPETRGQNKSKKPVGKKPLAKLRGQNKSKKPI